MQTKTQHVLEYLATERTHELDPWLSDDLQISWLAVWFAAQRYAHPWDYAFEHYLGRHPARLIPELCARTIEREKLLGPGIEERLYATARLVAEGQHSPPALPPAAPRSKKVTPKETT